MSATPSTAWDGSHAASRASTARPSSSTDPVARASADHLVGEGDRRRAHRPGSARSSDAERGLDPLLVLARRVPPVRGLLRPLGAAARAACRSPRLGRGPRRPLGRLDRLGRGARLAVVLGDLGAVARRLRSPASAVATSRWRSARSDAAQALVDRVLDRGRAPSRKRPASSVTRTPIATAGSSIVEHVARRPVEHQREALTRRRRARTRPPLRALGGSAPTSGASR